MIEIRNLTKTYGAVTAVDDLTVTIRPGQVTGFLGPNGAGKSTTMRAIVGLDRPDAGEVLIGGRRYADDPAPLHTVGALLDAAPLVHAGARRCIARVLSPAMRPGPAEGRARARTPPLVVRDARGDRGLRSSPRTSGQIDPGGAQRTAASARS